MCFLYIIYYHISLCPFFRYAGGFHRTVILQGYAGNPSVNFWICRISTGTSLMQKRKNNNKKPGHVFSLRELHLIFYSNASHCSKRPPRVHFLLHLATCCSALLTKEIKYFEQKVQVTIHIEQVKQSRQSVKHNALFNVLTLTGTFGVCFHKPQ